MFLLCKVLYKLLGFVGVKDLLACRSLSRNWNEISSYHLGRKECAIKFFKTGNEFNDDNPADESIRCFLLTMESRMAGPFPFSAFEFYFTYSRNSTEAYVPSLLTLERFVESHGKYAKSYSVHLEHFYEGDPSQLLECLLRKSSKLETLRLYGQNSEAATFVTFPSSLILSSLKNLIIMPYSPCIGWIPTDSDHDGTGKLSLSQVSSWITQTPAIQEIQSGFGVGIKSETEASSFLQSLQQFHLVELELKTEDMAILRGLIHCPLTSLHTLIMDVEDSIHLISSCLKSVAGTLKRLSLKLYGARNEIPCLASLEALELDFAEEEAEYPIEDVLAAPLQQSQFPALKTLTLKSYQSTSYDRVNENWSLFDGSVFETVELLELIDYHRPTPEPWHAIFPNLKLNGMPVSRATKGLVPMRRQEDTRQFSMRQLNIRSTYTNSDDQIILRPIYSNPAL